MTMPEPARAKSGSTPFPGPPGLRARAPTSRPRYAGRVVVAFSARGRTPRPFRPTCVPGGAGVRNVMAAEPPRKEFHHGIERRKTRQG
jgi:hypothetical protein